MVHLRGNHGEGMRDERVPVPLLRGGGKVPFFVEPREKEATQGKRPTSTSSLWHEQGEASEATKFAVAAV